MRKLMWFTLGFAAACLLTVYLLPEGALPWAAGICLAASLLPGLGFLTLGGKATTTEAGSPGTPLIRHPACGGRRMPPSPKGEGFRRLLCLGLGLALGLLWCWGYATLVRRPARELSGKYEGISAEILSDPEVLPYGQRAEARVELPEGSFRARLTLYGQSPELEPGDWIRGVFTLHRADRYSDGSRRLDLNAKGIQLVGSVKLRQYSPGNAPWYYFPARLSKAVYDRLGELIPADAVGLPQALVTGNRTGLSLAQREALRAAGASHVIAVSGLHVTLLIGLLGLLAGRGRLRVLLGLPLLVLFSLMTGASPSVLRASVMLGLLLLAPLFREEADPPSCLALAALLLLAQNPFAVSNLSFQLSFAAVAGLLLASQPVQKYLLSLPGILRLLRWQGPGGWRRLPRNLLVKGLRGLVRFLCGSLAASCGALVFTTPIAALSFGSMPLYGALTNLAAIPLTGLLLGGSLGVWGLGLISATLGRIGGWLLAWPVRLLLGLCRWVARLPGSSLWMDRFGLGFLIFAALLLLLVLLRKEKRLGPPLLCLLGALALAVGFQSLDRATASFALAALDVGQGQCVCASSWDFTAVMDCGGGSYATSTAWDWLRSHQAERIDALILTHYDADHMNGVPALLELIPVERIFLPEVDFDPENRALVEQAALEAGTEIVYVNQDLNLDFPGGELRIFGPVSHRNDNAACVSVLYSAGEYDMLVTGDLDSQGELALLARETLPQVELYVAGHHGSDSSSSAALLAAIQPETAFISVGSNSYGLPSAKVLERLEAAGARVYRTDEFGTLELSAP
ncbi:MAG: DNA internalization-related competence protein ComEC/Rec2 [Oscillospiraceae bacterium]|nr:DNA internalization-related competence protein ComEC/Rec2 [Oscillospiraceae bacterium]